MNLTAELMKKNFGEWTLLQIWRKNLANWAEFAGKTVALMPACISDQRDGGVDAIQVETRVNPSAKRLHTTISEMDAPLGGTRM